MGYWIKPFIACTLLLTLVGCSNENLMNPVSLIHAPTLPNQEAKVREAVQASLPHGSRLIVPRRANQLSAIHFICCNDEETKDAVAFFKENTSQMGLILLREQNDGTWQALSQYPLNGVEVDDAIFQDVTGDGRPEMIIGTTYDSTSSAYLSVLQYEDDEWQLLLEGSYDELLITDLNQDQLNELYLFYLWRNESFTATMYQFGEKDQQLEVTSRLELDPYVNGMESPVFAGQLTTDQSAIFLELGVGAHSAVTTVLGLKDGQLVDLINGDKPGQDRYVNTLKPHYLPSMDINHDGIVEVATCSEAVGSEGLSYAEMPFIENWGAWDQKTKSFKTVAQSYSHYGAKLRFIFPERLIKQLTIKEKALSQEDWQIQFYAITEDQHVGEELFSLYTLHKDQLDQFEKAWQAKGLEFLLLAEEEEICYLAVRYPQANGTHYMLSDEEIKAGFQILQY